MAFTPVLSIWSRLGALALLASVLPLAVQAPAPGGSSGAGGQPSEWLEAQVRLSADAKGPQDARRAFREALATARAADTRTLHGFLAAVLHAHAEQAGAPAPATGGRTSRALVAELRRRLTQAGLTVDVPAQATAPPAAPAPRVYWLAAASVLLPSPERSGPGAQKATSASASGLPPARVVSVVQRAAAPVARAVLSRILFAGRRLGP